jgi:CO/xanthine dehydrogenase Mo-binding subunit
MTEMTAKQDGLSVLDRPNAYIGRLVPRPDLDRLMQGRGLDVSDVVLPRMAHVVILRSPHAHAIITGIEYWVVEDCGTIINPQRVDEQIRGGVVQGLGAALFEKCIYDERGQLTNANMADYLVPMSGEMPDIDVGHVVSPAFETELGAKGAGEAGTAGAAAVVANAVNDALRPFGVTITEIPLTPRVILTALGRV